MRAIDLTYENVKKVLDDHGFYRDQINRFYDMSKLFPTIEVPRWIPVTERLPEVSGNCLCYCKGKIRILKYWRTGESFEYCGKPMPVTHWMPIPEAPKDGE